MSYKSFMKVERHPNLDLSTLITSSCIVVSRGGDSHSIYVLHVKMSLEDFCRYTAAASERYARSMSHDDDEESDGRSAPPYDFELVVTDTSQVEHRVMFSEVREATSYYVHRCEGERMDFEIASSAWEALGANNRERAIATYRAICKAASSGHLSKAFEALCEMSIAVNIDKYEEPDHVYARSLLAESIGCAVTCALSED